MYIDVKVVLKFEISKKVWHNPSIAFPILCYLLSYCQLGAEKFMSQQIIENILLLQKTYNTLFKYNNFSVTIVIFTIKSIKKGECFVLDFDN